MKKKKTNRHLFWSKNLWRMMHFLHSVYGEKQCENASCVINRVHDIKWLKIDSSATCLYQVHLPCTAKIVCAVFNSSKWNEVHTNTKTHISHTVTYRLNQWQLINGNWWPFCISLYRWLGKAAASHAGDLSSIFDNGKCFFAVETFLNVFLSYCWIILPM